MTHEPLCFCEFSVNSEPNTLSQEVGVKHFYLSSSVIGTLLITVCYFVLLQEIPQVHLGLDMHLCRVLQLAPLHLGPSLSFPLPPPPLSVGSGGVTLVGLSVPPDPAGGCSRSLL